MSQLSKQHFWLIITLMVTIIIDVMGIGVIFPTLPQLFIGHHSVFGSHIQSKLWQEFDYGFSMAAWPLGLFFGAAMMGHLSDIVGRRKVILVCLFMTAVTYAICGFAIHMSSAWLFLLGRLLSGFFAGSFEIAQAVIADISPPEKKARNMGWITLSASLGFIIGPLIASFTTEPSISSFFTLATPFWIATVLSFINMLSIFFLLKESYRHVGEVKLDWLACFKSVGFVFKDKRVRFLGLVFLLLQFGWGMYFMPLSGVLNILYGYDSVTLGLFMAVIGVACGFATIVVQPLLQKIMSLRSMLIWSLFLTAFFLVFAVIFDIKWIQWTVGFFAPMVEVLAYTGSIALFSNSVSETEQGTAMGGAGTLVSIAWFMGGMVTGPTLVISWHIPLAISMIFMLIPACLALKLKR